MDLKMQSFKERLMKALEESLNSQYHQKIINQLLTTNDIYVVGRNNEALLLHEKYNICALIDDFASEGDYWNSIPIVKVRDVPIDSIVINCVTSISPVEVDKILKQAGLENVLTISDLIAENLSLLPLPWFVSQQRAEIQKNFEWWQYLYNNMSDEISKKILLDVARYRMTADLQYMFDYKVRLNDQYFENFMGYTNELFVDAGGYDGDTTEEFILRYPDYKKVVLFEPSKQNLQAAMRRLEGYSGIDFKSVGLSDKSGHLYFDADAGSASSITEGQGGESIRVVRLDEELKDEEVTFIKMDLEGWELKALKGSESIISKHKPKLAIAVYHSAKDFRCIPQYLLRLNPDYKIYLRHYTQGWSETVMFFR